MTYLKHETSEPEIHQFEIIQPHPILVKNRRLNSQNAIAKIMMNILKYKMFSLQYL